MPPQLQSRLQLARKAFNSHAKHLAGYLSKQELEQAAAEVSVGQSQVREWLQQFDGQCLMSLAQFLELVKRATYRNQPEK